MFSEVFGANVVGTCGYREGLELHQFMTGERSCCLYKLMFGCSQARISLIVGIEASFGTELTFLPHLLFILEKVGIEEA